MRIPRRIAICLVWIVAFASSEHAVAVTFEDPDLKGAFNKALGRPPGYEPTLEDMAKVTVLAASNPAPACFCGGTDHSEHFAGLVDGGLGGIQYATALEELYLEGHCRTAIDRVGGLTKLRRLDLRCNLLDSGDAASLAGLHRLVALRLGHNEDITSVSGLLTSPASLPALNELRLESCNVSDIAGVTTSTLPALRLIDVTDNRLCVDAYRFHVPALVARLGESNVLRDPPRCLQVTTHGEGSVSVDDHDSTDHMTLYRPWYHPKAPVHAVRLLAVPTAPYWRFDRWANGATGTNPDITITMSRDRQVDAYFARNTCTLTVASDGCGTVSGAGTCDCGSVVPIAAMVQPCCRFVNWTQTGDVVVANPSSPSTTVTVNGDGMVTAHCATESFALAVGVDPAGSGTVACSPGGPTYTCGEQVTLTATANPCYRFAGWSGDASGAANPMTVTMDRSKSITAGFAIVAYTLAVNTSGDCTVTRTPDKSTYNCGEQVILQAVAGSCARFTGWSGGAGGVANPITVTMDCAKSITATCVTDAPTLTTSVNPTGGGTVTRSPDKAGYDCGEPVTLTATAASCYSFSGWSGDASGTTNPLSVAMDRRKSIVAGFTLRTYTLTIRTVGSCSVARTPDKPVYNCNEQVTLRATAAACYRFTGWSGDASGAANPITITMDGSKTVTATCAKLAYTLKIDAADGTVTRTPDKSPYDCGDIVELKAVTDACHEFTGWSGDASGTTNPLTVTMDRAKTITAGFREIGCVVPKTIAILDVSDDSGATKRAVCFYDVADIRTADGRVFNRLPTFSVWTGYADSQAKQFEAPGSIAVNPINGTVYVLAMDPGTPGQRNAATGDFSGDYDLYRIDYQKILKDFIANRRPRGIMYAPRFGPDYNGAFGAQVDHPDYKGKTIFIDDAIEKIAELARNQGTSLFDYDLEFVSPARLVVLDNEKDSSVDSAKADHSFMVFNRLSLDPAAAGGARETWDANELGLVNLDFNASGKPAGRSEPIGIQYYVDPVSGAAGLWVAESNGGGDALAFFEITNWTGQVGNRYRPFAVGAGPALPITLVIDSDPILHPGAADGRLDWLRLSADGSLVLGEPGADTAKAEPKIITRQVVNYADAKSGIVLGPWAVAGPIHPSKDDDSAVTSGGFVAYDKGEDLVYFFDPDGGSGPSGAADVYVFDLRRKEMAYEELDAVNHSMKRHGIELFVRGDIDQDGRVDANDVAALLSLVAADPDPVTDEMYDLTGDRRLDHADVSELVEGILHTTLADLHLTAAVLAPGPYDAGAIQP